MPLVRRTRAILRIAEFGLRGVFVVTLVQTPRLNGEGYQVGRFLSVLKPRVSATAFDLVTGFVRFRRTSWLIVDISLNKNTHIAYGTNLLFYHCQCIGDGSS